MADQQSREEAQGEQRERQQQYDDSPQVASQPSYPEVVPEGDRYPEQYQYHQQPISPAGKYEDQAQSAVYPGAYGSTFYDSTISPSTAHPEAATLPPQGQAPETNKARGTICGCSVVVFVLVTIIALLIAAVVGLAAGTGIEARRANDATNQLAQVSASVTTVPAKTVTVTTAAPTTTPWAALDNKCSSDPDNVSGQSYTSFKLLGAQTFTMACNKDAPGTNLLSLFVADFNACMDACSAFTMYETANFGAANINSTCAAVSFIPLWTVKSDAKDGKAPGNCYLKPGPQSLDTLRDPNIGTECHAAFVSQHA